MKTFDNGSPERNNVPERQIRGGAGRLLLAALVSSMFLVTAQAGLTSIASFSLISIQILLELCRLAVAAFQIFAR